jgi:hypothetical protein
MAIPADDLDTGDRRGGGTAADRDRTARRPRGDRHTTATDLVSPVVSGTTIATARTVTVTVLLRPSASNAAAPSVHR